jgi:hypothetical protein
VAVHPEMFHRTESRVLLQVGVKVELVVVVMVCQKTEVAVNI